MAQATPEVPLPDATAVVIGALKVPTHGAVITLTSSPPTPPTAISPTPSTILDHAATELDRLRKDLLGADPRLVARRLKLASGWVRSNASVRAALVQASTTCDEEKLAILEAKAARDAALGEVADAQGRCKALEDELQGLRGQLTKEVRLRQEQEEGVKAREAAVKEREVKLRRRHDHLGALEQELGARKVELDDKAQVLVEDRVAFAEMEAKARSSLRTLYDSGLESPLAGAEDGPAKLLPFLVRALEDVALGLGPTAEAEARVLSSAALTRVLTHIYLRDPGIDLDSLLEPVSGEHAAAAAEAVKGRAEALLGKFRAFNTKPKQGATDPTAP